MAVRPAPSIVRPDPTSRPTGGVRVELPIDSPPPASNGGGANGGSGSAPSNSAPSGSNGNGAAVSGAGGNGAENGDGGVVEMDFLMAEMTMPLDADDNDFDDELLRLSHKIHNILVDELGGQQFKSDDRERLRRASRGALR